MNRRERAERFRWGDGDLKIRRPSRSTEDMQQLDESIAVADAGESSEE